MRSQGGVMRSWGRGHEIVVVHKREKCPKELFDLGMQMRIIKSSESANNCLLMALLRMSK